MSQFAWTFPGGKVVDNYDDSATVDQTGAAKDIDITVPTGKIWLLLNTIIETAVSQGLRVTIYNSTDKIIRVITYNAASTGLVYPSSSYPYATHILPASWYVRFAFLGAETAANIIVCNILEIDAP